jgi:hypothetical protein
MTKIQLVRGRDGEIVPQPCPSEDPEPLEPLELRPDPDGRYHLLPGDEATALAWELFERGVPVYCGRCRAPLKISRAHVLCSKDARHFHVVV